jgi:hypothetical protein
MSVEPAGIVDRLADWLVTRCPFCTLAALSVLVVGPTIGPIPQPWLVAASVVLADVAFLIMRRMAASQRAARWRTR